MSEELEFALLRADSNNQPPDAAENTQLNARGFFRFSGSSGYEYVNRDTISSPTGDGKTHVILFQHEPINYVKLDSDMQPEVLMGWDTFSQIIAFLDSPVYQGNGPRIGVSVDAIIGNNVITITTTVDAVLI